MSKTFIFKGRFVALQSLTMTLNGAHQLKNAAVAVMTLEVLRQYYALIVEDEDSSDGLTETTWPGRLEMVSRAAADIARWRSQSGRDGSSGGRTSAIYIRIDKLNVMVAMMPNKNHEHSLRHILPMVDTLIITEPDFHKKMNAERLADCR